METKFMLFVTLMILVKGSLQTNQCDRVKTIIHKKCKCLLPRKKETVKTVEIECVNTDKYLDFNPIPPMPNNTSHLYLRGFQFNNVTKETFKNLENIVELTTITLLNNSVSNISNDAFQEMKSLRKLEISWEKLVSKQEISAMFYRISRKIDTLAFSHNTWLSPPSFNGLQNTSLNHLILSYNYFRTLKGEWFSDLPYLQTLDVSANGISEGSYNFTGLEKIRNLYLNGNWFKEFPNFCNYSWDLSRLQFQNNKLTSFLPSYFQCLPSLTDLTLNGHDIRVLYDNTFSNLTSLRTLNIQRLAGQLLAIDARAFESKSLQKLVFTRNSFVFHNSFLEYFQHCPNLTELYINSNYFRLKEDEFITMIKPLKKLTKLGIQNMRLFFLPRNLLKHLPVLKELDASQNYLNGSWDGISIFGNTPTLKILNLSDNNIEKFTAFNFPTTLLNGMSKGGLDLSYNKFSCNCDDAYWFYKWMHSNKEKVANVLHITCEHNIPIRTSSVNLFDLKERDLCPINPALLIAIIASCNVLPFLIYAILYKLRWNIRHWLYVIKYKSRGYDTISNDPDYKYDVFLVYAEEDRVFIFETIVPYLETKGYSLCVRSRDFEFGKLYCDNIVDNMNLSRRILLVLSNSFAISKWCEFQLNFAYNRCLDEKINNIVVAVFEEISIKYFSNTLKVLLNSYEYALWSKSDETRQTLFWEKVLRKLQFRTNHTECANGMIRVIQ